MEQNTTENNVEEPKLLAEQSENLNLLEYRHNTEEKERHGRKINLELILLVILGFLIGVVVKTEASRRFTIGYEDYKVAQNKQAFNIEKIEKDLVQKISEEQNSGGKINQ
jgi:hypothetical protein